MPSALSGNGLEAEKYTQKDQKHPVISLVTLYTIYIHPTYTAILTIICTIQW